MTLKLSLNETIVDAYTLLPLEILSAGKTNTIAWLKLLCSNIFDNIVVFQKSRMI